MSSPRLWGLVILPLLAAAACGDGSREPVGPEPVPLPSPDGTWVAQALRGAPLPAAIYVFDPDETYGYPASVHMVVDSAHLELQADGRYLHRIWVTEWEGDVGGPPHTVRYRWPLGDHGGWSRTDGSMRLESWYLQNLVMEGAYGAPGVLELRHGLTHGDPPAPFTYRRR
ncbi:MAG TPA: hypothetical protein VLA43_12680 [Longimicrobiales bacterium]|nr:hypothetical protein [Longimicrobiales bacterium]